MVSREELKQFITAKRGPHPAEWEITQVGAYTYKGNIELFCNYSEQGTCEVVKKELFEKILFFPEVLDKEEYPNINDAVEYAYTAIELILGA